jgi:hypothetical protein
MFINHIKNNMSFIDKIVNIGKDIADVTGDAIEGLYNL